MNLPHSLDVINEHALVWNQLNQLIANQRLPQALLFVGPQHLNLIQCARRFMSLIICANNRAPCETCRSCICLINDTHPDITYITNNEMKIDQVRSLQQDIYQPPQFAAKRFIVLDEVNKMNIASSNALLKILEEPPKHTIFILLTENIISIAPTILSRCQKYMFFDQNNFSAQYTELGKLYNTKSTRFELCMQSEKFIYELKQLLASEITPCELAKIWSTYNLGDLLWFLYLLIAQLIRNNVINLGCSKIKLFNQLSILSKYITLNQNNVSLNGTLLLERFLLGFF